jgi:hypothetical protein
MAFQFFDEAPLGYTVWEPTMSATPSGPASNQMSKFNPNTRRYEHSIQFSDTGAFTLRTVGLRRVLSPFEPLPPS